MYDVKERTYAGLLCLPTLKVRNAMCMFNSWTSIRFHSSYSYYNHNVMLLYLSYTYSNCNVVFLLSYQQLATICVIVPTIILFLHQFHYVMYT